MEPALLESLAQKLELPSDVNRFDRPVITVHSAETLPIQLLSEALLDPARAMKPNASTAEHQAEAPRQAHQADRATLDIVSAVLAAANSPTFAPGDSVSVPGATKKLVLRRRVALAELRRLRGEFMRVALPHLTTIGSVQDSFLDFLESRLAR